MSSLYSPNYQTHLCQESKTEPLEVNEYYTRHGSEYPLIPTYAMDENTQTVLETYIGQQQPAPRVNRSQTIGTSGWAPGYSYSHVVPSRGYSPNHTSPGSMTASPSSLNGAILPSPTFSYQPASRFILLPQERYQDRSKKTWYEEIRFHVNGVLGFSLKSANAKEPNYTGLDVRDEPFATASTSISIRIIWPGYPAFSKQFKTRNWKSPPSPITQGKLATEIAKAFDAFIKKYETEMVQSGHESWAVGPGYIELHHLILLSVKRVSESSWQAEVGVMTG